MINLDAIKITPRDQEVLRLLAQGCSNKVIGTTEQVVKNYLRTAFDKVGVWSRLELALYVASHGGVNWVSELCLDTGEQAVTASAATRIA